MFVIERMTKTHPMTPLFEGKDSNVLHKMEFSCKTKHGRRNVQFTLENLKIITQGWPCALKFCTMVEWSYG
jgi:hypothetical protein